MAAMQSKPLSQTSLRRSLSDTHLSKNRRSRCTFSSTSSKSSWTSRLAKLLARLAFFSRDSELTEERLEAHNKRIIEEDEKIPKSSPYYRGLTDSSLAIHRSSLVPGHGGHHYAGSVATTHASFSSIVARLKEWSPCLGKNRNFDKDRPEKSAEKMQITKASAAMPPPPKTTKTRKEESESFPVKETKAEKTQTKAPPPSSSSLAFPPPPPKTTKMRKEEFESFPVKETKAEKIQTKAPSSSSSSSAFSAPPPKTTKARKEVPESFPTNAEMIHTRASSSASPPPPPKTAKTRKEESFPVKEREKREDVVDRIKQGEDQEKLLRERLYSNRQVGSEAAAAAAPPGVAVENEKDRELEVVERDRFTWGDNYRPKKLDEFICNRNKARQLKDEVRERKCGHYIFEGPPGVGKRTMIQAMIRETFGNEAMEIREVIKVFDLKSEMVGSIQVNLKESPHYVEVNLSQTKGYEKQVIVQLIKETHSPLPCSRANCRGITLCEADKLSNETLMYVRWVIERYKGCNKIFFCCSDISKLQPVKSLCHVVQLLPPSNKEIVEVLDFIAKQQGFDLSSRLADRIADNSKNNLRQAIRSLEASWDKSHSFQEDGDQLLTGWEDDIADVAKKIVDEQSPKQLYIVRGKLKKLIEHDVSPHFIFRTLVDEIKKLLDEELQRRIEGLYADYNKNEEKAYVTEKDNGEEGYEETTKRLHDPMRKNFHHFLKIEEFIAKFMSCYKGEANKKNDLPPTRDI